MFKCEVLLDLLYNLKIVICFINCVMFDGKCGIVVIIVYDVFEVIKEVIGIDVFEVFEIVMENIMFVFEVCVCCVGGLNY